MNPAHVHIVLNHIPSLGSVAGLVLLAAAIYRRDDGLKKFSFFVLVLMALAVLPTYIAGAESQSIIWELPGVSRPMMQLHQNAAMLTLLAMVVSGTFAWFGLWEFRRFSRASALITSGTLLFAAISTAFILYAANIGGKISHPEIREAADAGVTEAAGWREPIELIVSDHSWVWPASETVHFIGMCMLFGVSLLLMLRMLGAVKSIPVSALHRLLPLGVLGFVMNVLTGMLFFIAGPGLYLGKTAFHIKITCIVLAGIPLLYFTMADRPWHTGSDKSASLISKAAAVCAFGLLVAVVIYGRLLPFLY